MSQNMQMTDRAERGFTLQDLEIQKLGLEGRIRKIEQDLHEPMSPDSSEQAVQNMQFIFMKRLSFPKFSGHFLKSGVTLSKEHCYGEKILQSRV